MARLIWKKTESPADDVIFEISEETQTIGRDPKCGIFMDTPLLSREHARLEMREGKRFLIDLGSTNFTKVNGQRITETELQGGENIHFSRAHCVYEA